MKNKLTTLFLAAITCFLSACGDMAHFPATFPPLPGGEQIWEVDVVVIGAGGAGMTAGVAAARAGKRVLILEKSSTAGGNSARSTGGMNAVKTQYQDDNGWNESAGVENTLSSAAAAYPDLAGLADVVRREFDVWSAHPNGYFDSVGLFILDTMASGRGRNDLELVTTLAENSAGAVNWLETAIGAPLPAVSFYPGSSVKRLHRPVNSEGKIVSVGAYVTPILEQACIDNGVEILFNTPVTEILMDSGRAVGVKADSCIVNAQSVIIASGGFGAAPDMVSQWRPDLHGFITTNSPHSTGDGILLAQAVGAATVDMDQIQICSTVEPHASVPIAEELRTGGAILVNAEGKRFCDETGSRSSVSAAELAQTGGEAWLILDQRIADSHSVFDSYIDKGYTVQGDSYEALSSIIGVPSDILADTLEKWNRAVAAYTDEEFGRTSFAGPLNAPPFYAIKVAPGIHHTLGGVKINSFAQVLGTDDQAIPGLFAAGEVTGGIHGANCLEGNAVTDFVVFGKIAGESAAAE